jgi:hypothetical protein
MTTTSSAVQALLFSTNSITAQLRATIRLAQSSGNTTTEAALIRASSALEEAMRHLREADAPFAPLIYAHTAKRIIDIEPDAPSTHPDRILPGEPDPYT